jgi:AcrR family transcriptional regulator
MARVRRSPVELRETIIKAAEEAFAREGYGAVSLKQVAQDAGVAESVLYRHFPSKAALFREAVLLPLMTFLESFSEASERYLDYALDDRSLMRLVIGSLLDQLGEHRAALRSIIAAEEDLGPEERERFHQALADVLIRMGEIARAEAIRRGSAPPGLGIEVTARVLVGAIISLVIYEDWLLRGLPQEPSRADLLDHLVEIMLRASGAELD